MLYEAEDIINGYEMMQNNKKFLAGETLMTEGEFGRSAYIIESGEVEILVSRGTNKLRIGTRGAGTIVGEIAMIDEQPRTATVRAIQDCEVIEITRTDFENWVQGVDPVFKLIIHVILTRYRDMLSRSFFSSTVKSGAETAEKDGELYDLALKTIKMKEELKAAIGNELVLYYQPIIDIQNRKVVGFEALMRWMHPEKGMISPGAFIPIAEQSGLIVEMSQWALLESARASHRLNEVASELKGEDPLYISVNFSVRDFASDSFFDNVQKTLTETNTPAGHIHLEIVETILAEKPEIARAALDQCREIGLSISIDDFGTGYSSLSYLHNFPIQTLKIDRSFVCSMLEKPNNLALIRSIIGLAKNLNLDVIAEGVETQEEARTLYELDCQNCQGFLFARPMPEKEAIAFLKNGAVVEF